MYSEQLKIPENRNEPEETKANLVIVGGLE